VARFPAFGSAAVGPEMGRIWCVHASDTFGCLKQNQFASLFAAMAAILSNMPFRNEIISYDILSLFYVVVGCHHFVRDETNWRRTC
jgi:hypothetical protein